nr:CbiX/SirB N-terminal domain-containing protein [Corynebacterium aquatimens]
MSHGSRHPKARPGVAALTRAAAHVLGLPEGGYADAHLEFDTPDLVTAAQSIAENGYQSAVVVPTLFTKAFHATHDVPEAIAEARAITGVDLVAADGLGQGDDIADLLAARALRDCGNTTSRIILYPVGTSTVAAAEKTVALGAAVEKRAGIEVTTIPATGHGKRDLADVAAHDAHLLPLFVTEGLLLDRAFRMWPGSTSAPLSADLASVVASRYSRALAHADALVRV